ncbi:MAG: hypothetical protein EBV19_09590, partial [Flavobacteriia bacterium]|nr:hypothetical protein [Flavobacteriia bacterium]
MHKRGAGNKKLPPKSYFSKLLVPILPTTKIDLEKAAYVKPPPIKPKKTKLPPKSYFFKSNVPKSHDSDLRPVNHKNPIPIARRIPDEDHIPYKPVSRGILDNSQKPFSRNRHDQAKEIQLPSRRYEPDGISRRMSNTDFPKYRHDDKAKEIPTPSKNIRRTKSDIKPTL